MPHRRHLWSGRFKEPLSELALKFSSSIDIDKALYREDIEGSIAHVEMLAACRIITPQEMRRIRSGLNSILQEIETGKLSLSWDKEDIHMAIEKRLIEKIGQVGGKLHSGRSRNDQVALDERLYLRGAVFELRKLLVQLERVLLYKAERHFDTLIPGYTHMQRAQPIYLSQHLLAYLEMFERDYDRFGDCLSRFNKLPLGAAALAGTSLPIDRAAVAKKLGFDGIVTNSMDAVSDRDYLIEFVSACSITMMHLSRFAEELVLWCSQEFSFARIDDAYTTGSSIMPQKKNPDMAELVRGKSGRVFGDLMNLLTIMKGLPLAYNRDMQEDKMPMFDSVSTTRQCLFIFSHMLVHTTFSRERFEKELNNDFTTATDLAEYLVRKGIPFRESHSITGKVVASAIEQQIPLGQFTLKELQHFSKAIGEDVFEILDPRRSVEHKASAGSTSPHEVKKQIVHWSRVLKNRIR
ncbi:MAG: argininosuccinate lyase [Ignavibacteriales bacterium]|nr:argininosuccinate lyase [Ignavibacteriales bacterium]